MQEIGLSISGLLAFGGVGGLIVGLAAKDLLSNFFGGMMIFFDRPFRVGEFIKSPDRNIEGIVEKIGWRLTVVRTFSKNVSKKLPESFHDWLKSLQNPPKILQDVPKTPPRPTPDALRCTQDAFQVRPGRTKDWSRHLKIFKHASQTPPKLNL